MDFFHARTLGVKGEAPRERLIQQLRDPTAYGIYETWSVI